MNICENRPRLSLDCGCLSLLWSKFWWTGVRRTKSQTCLKCLYETTGPDAFLLVLLLWVCYYYSVRLAECRTVCVWVCVCTKVGWSEQLIHWFSRFPESSSKEEIHLLGLHAPPGTLIWVNLQTIYYYKSHFLSGGHKSAISGAPPPPLESITPITSAVSGHNSLIQYRSARPVQSEAHKWDALNNHSLHASTASSLLMGKH